MHIFSQLSGDRAHNGPFRMPCAPRSSGSFVRNPMEMRGLFATARPNRRWRVRDRLANRSLAEQIGFGTIESHGGCCDASPVATTVSRCETVLQPECRIPYSGAASSTRINHPRICIRHIEREAVKDLDTVAYWLSTNSVFVTCLCAGLVCGRNVTNVARDKTHMQSSRTSTQCSIFGVASRLVNRPGAHYGANIDGPNAVPRDSLCAHPITLR